MNDLTPEDRARALELYRLHFRLTNDYESVTISPDQLGNLANTWLAVEAHVLASHTCPDVESDAHIRAWSTIAQHPFFADCYQTEGTLVDAMLAELDAAHTHTCTPKWRPTTFEEIQPGWEVRTRYPNGMEAMWGVAHHKSAGDWFTEEGARLTYRASGWSCTYETTAPAPEPEPWPDELVDAITGTIWPIDRAEDARAVLDLLAARGLIDRAAVTGGEQS